MKETTHRLVAGDSADLSFVPSGSIAAVITSPPYPMIEMWDGLFQQLDPQVEEALKEGDGERAFGLMHEYLDETWTEIYRILIEGGWACIVIGDATRSLVNVFKLYSNHTRILQKLSALGFDVLPPILWRKQTNAPNKFMGSGMLPAGAYVTLEHEHILILRKGRKRAFGSKEERGARQQSAYFWEERNLWFSDLWDLKGARQAWGHPGLRDRSAAFPFELAYRLVNMFSIQGDTLFDPFLGTGTTTAAAIASGRNSIGVELDGSFIDVFRKEAESLEPVLNQYLLKRLNRHLEFIGQYRKRNGASEYTNLVHGFPVVTSQERKLTISLIKAIRADAGDTLVASYVDASETMKRIRGREAERLRMS